MKLRIYTDLSVLAGCENDEFREGSRRLVDSFVQGKNTMVLSELTLRELENSTPEVQRLAGDIPEKFCERLMVTDEAIALANAYLNTGLRIETFPSEPEVIADQAPVVRLVNVLLAKAISDGAEMIHIQSFPNYVRLTVQVNGETREMPPPPRTVYEWIIRRLKIVAGMNILKNREQQEGQFTFRYNQRAYNVNVVTCPGEHGEEATICFKEVKFFMDEYATNSKVFTDALHIATATIGQVDYLVTLNPGHLKPETDWIYRDVNSRNNYTTPYMMTPDHFYAPRDL